ncbi:MAG: hypothetical protein ACE5J5_06400 [Candidatus Hydrothermarchaeales archaeon]
MEFCPRCKNTLFPRNKEGKIILICHNCGHEVKKFKQSKYKMTEKTQHDRTEILIVDATTGEDKEEKLKYFGDLYGSDLEFEE